MWDREYVFLAVLLVLIAALFAANIEKIQYLNLQTPDNIDYDEETKTLNISTLTLKQKIGQMVVTYGKDENTRDLLQSMVIGGIHLDSRQNKKEFKGIINRFQDDSVIPMMITADLEGCRNPMQNIMFFPSFKDIYTEDQAYLVGQEAGKLLTELGFTVNFAPVVDLEDNVWHCRTFNGTPDEVSAKANAYIKGLQDNGIAAVSKHYPGRTMAITDLHADLAYAEIYPEDLIPFQKTKSNVAAIMVSHTIVDGVIDSEDLPSTLSPSVVGKFRKGYDGVIFTDEIGMMGLRKFYTENNVNQMFVDLINAGNDVILNFDRDPRRLYYMISAIARAVDKGELTEERIDESVIRIMKLKGITVVY